MTSRGLSRCQPCRDKHDKCDQVLPVCGRCRDLGRECTKRVLYRYHPEEFAENQKWVQISDRLTFIDESEDVANHFWDEGEEGEDRTPPHLRPNSASLSDHQLPQLYPQMAPSEGIVVLPPLHAVTSYNSNGQSRPSELQTVLHRFADFTHGIPPAYMNFANDMINNSRTISPVSISTQSSNLHPPLALPVTTSNTSIHLDRPIWPLEDLEEARLLRHFVQKLAIWLDLCDPMQHFQVEVPKRAGTCPLLLNAIFALSARHLALTEGYDPLVSNRYYDICLEGLIPTLGPNKMPIVGDETVFAATIILRVLEELESPENIHQGHMLGIQAFVSARDPDAMGGGLGVAAFWVGLRQEIYSAMLTSKAIVLNLEHGLVDRSVSPTSDFGWANRAVVHCADVLTWCFDPSQGSLAEWQVLKAASERWRDNAPTSFDPIYYRAPNPDKSEVFPELWYSMACHVIGIQHHKLGEILLSIFDPGIPKVGANRRIAVKAMEAEVIPNLKSLCGIALSNRWTPPGMFTASMGIALCGDRVTIRREQEALLDVLAKTEVDHARPTALVQEQMKASWGWDDAE